MGFTNKLCNPTPWEASWNYSRGVFITVPPFGEVDLPSIQMVEDFRPDRPGSENVQANMHVLGIFLLDPNRSYDAQALETISACLAAHENRYRESTTTLRRDASTSGMKLDDTGLEEIYAQHGLHKVREKIVALKEMKDQYRSTVEERGGEIAAQTYDPERTIFVLPVPKEFPSRTAMRTFLAQPENEETRKKHEAWNRAAVSSQKVVTKVVDRTPKKEVPSAPEIPA